MVTAQRAIGVAIVILALVVGIIPSFYNCASRDLYLYVRGMDATSTGPDDGETMLGGGASGSTGAATSMGRKVPMRCFYSAKAAIGMAIPLGVLGLLFLFSRRRETNRMLGVMGVVLGAVTMAVPTVVGTCGSAAAICNEVLKPTMQLAGGLVMVLSAIVLTLGEQRRESTA